MTTGDQPVWLDCIMIWNDNRRSRVGDQPVWLDCIMIWNDNRRSTSLARTSWCEMTIGDQLPRLGIHNDLKWQLLGDQPVWLGLHIMIWDDNRRSQNLLECLWCRHRWASLCNHLRIKTTSELLRQLPSSTKAAFSMFSVVSKITLCHN